MQRILAIDEQPDHSPEQPADSGYGFKTEDFEFVVGRRQVAAFAFVALVVVAVCSSGAYLAGKVISARDQQPIKVELPLAPTPPPVPVIEATIALPPEAVAPKPAAEAPLFANPSPQAIYIQVGAVEKGVATVIAEGLRKHALDSFVAPGPSGKTFRVLVGPFPDAAAYQKARNVVDEIGLASFARRYQSQ